MCKNFMRAIFYFSLFKFELSLFYNFCVRLRNLNKFDLFINTTHLIINFVFKEQCIYFFYNCEIIDLDSENLEKIMNLKIKFIFKFKENVNGKKNT